MSFNPVEYRKTHKNVYTAYRLAHLDKFKAYHDAYVARQKAKSDLIPVVIFSYKGKRSRIIIDDSYVLQYLMKAKPIKSKIKSKS